MILFRQDNMDPKKLFLWPAIISIIGHVVLIFVSSLVDLRDNVKAEKLFTVEITQRQSFVEPKAEENTGGKKRRSKLPKQNSFRCRKADGRTL